MTDLYLAKLDPAKAIYTATLGDGDGVADASVRLGALSKTDILVPNINAGKWGDEAWINLNYREMVVGKSATQDFKNSVAEVTVGDIKFRSWVLNKSVLEGAIVWASIPSTGPLRFDFSSSTGIIGYPQPALTQTEIDAGHFRPVNATGGIAFFYGRRNNKYKTGMHSFLHRFECIDAKGRRAWCGHWNLGDGCVLAEKPDEWLKSATYPVVCMGAGDTIGYSNFSGSSSFGGLQLYSSHDTPDDDGTISTLHIGYTNTSGTDYGVKVAVYDDDAGNNRPEDQLASEIELACETGNSSTEKNGAYSASISGGTKYWLAWVGEHGSLKIHYHTLDSNRQHYASNEGGYDLPATWPDSGSNDTTQWVLWATYAVSGGITDAAEPLSRTIIPQFLSIGQGLGVSLLRSLSISAEAGSLVLTGSAADLIRALKIAADTGSIEITGTDADLLRALKVSGDSGALVLSGTDSDLLRALKVSAEAGSLVLSGTAADLLRALSLSADAGSLFLSGTDADLLRGLKISADAGSVVLTGTEASLLRALNLAADAGSIVITGTDATLTYNEAGEIVFSVDPGAISLSGTAANLLYGRILSALPGTVVFRGAADLLLHRVLSAAAGALNLTGTDVDFQLGRVFSVSPGQLVITGTAASLDYSGQVAHYTELTISIECDPLSVTLTCDPLTISMT